MPSKTVVIIGGARLAARCIWRPVEHRRQAFTSYFQVFEPWNLRAELQRHREWISQY